MRIQIMSAVVMLLASSVSFADPLTCNLAAYKATAGLTAAMSDNMVWGDGKMTERQIVAAWDVATNGAFVQPIRLSATATTSSPR